MIRKDAFFIDKKFFQNLLYERTLKGQKMNLKPVMACEDTCIIYRSKLYLKLVKHGLWSPFLYLNFKCRVLSHLRRSLVSIKGIFKKLPSNLYSDYL